MKRELEKVVAHFSELLSKIRYGIPSCGLVETVRVECYGQKLPIQALGQTTAQQGHLTVTPYDVSNLGPILEALTQAGLNAYLFSKTALAVSLPKFVSEEDLDRSKAQVKRLEEEAKVSLRLVRKRFRSALDPESGDTRKAEKEIQTLTDQQIARVETLAKAKLAELSL